MAVAARLRWQLATPKIGSAPLSFVWSKLAVASINLLCCLQHDQSLPRLEPTSPGFRGSGPSLDCSGSTGRPTWMRLMNC